MGDEIGIAPTGLKFDTSEQRTIATIDATGTNTVITFTPALEYTHYGSPDESMYKINNVDTRGEVISRSCRLPCRSRRLANGSGES